MKNFLFLLHWTGTLLAQQTAIISCRVTAVLLVSILLLGCFEVSTVIKVKPDGSGTVEETVLMGPSMMMMVQMAAQTVQEGQKGKPPEKFSLFKEDSLKKRAATMGPGVTFVSAQPLKEGDREGFKALYRFKDIEQLKVSLNPTDIMPSAGEKPGEAPKKQEPILFMFIKGAMRTLLIIMPQQEFKEKSSQTKDAKPQQVDSAQNLLAMQMFLKDLKISIAVEVEGSVVETNASFAEGPKVTLMEVDFGKLLTDPEKLKKLSDLSPQSVEEAKFLMKEFPGMKIETNKITRVVFQ